MAVTKAKKTRAGREAEQELKNVSNVIVATYSKLTVAQDYELRKTLRGSGAQVPGGEEHPGQARRKRHQVEEALKDLARVTSIAYTTGDPVALAKALTKYAKDNPEFTFKAGVVEGRVISSKRSKRWPPCRRRKSFIASCCS